MANLKELKSRIASVQSTRRITSAMKMVAAAKLKKAQGAAEAARPYAERMARILGQLATAAGGGGDNAPAMMAGTGRDDVHLLVVIASDRGLCGGFNASLTRLVRARIAALEKSGKTAKLMIVGRKGVAMLRRDFGSRIVAGFEDLVKPVPAFAHADTIAERITAMLRAEEFDVCTLYYNKFVSALTQEATPLQLIPLASAEEDDTATENGGGGGSDAQYEFEPDEDVILESLLPKNMAVQIFRAMLESFASEQGARMTAMDNATRNAGDMINSLSITYNRSRQAQITKELIEIISGAEAL